MLIVFGFISIDLNLDVEALPGNNETVSALQYTMEPGGRGANQALAAARSGAKVTLVAKAGEDSTGSEIIDKLHDEGITVSGVAHGSNPTGTTTTIRDTHGLSHTVIATGANTELSADQIPEEILNDKVLVLLQTDIDPEQNAAVLEKAKHTGAQTMMNLAPAIDLTQKALDHLDYLVVNQEQAHQLAKKLGLNVEDNALKMAQGLSKQGGLNCIITIGDRGGMAVTKDGTGWSVEALPIENMIDHSGAEDSYSGTLAACIQAGLPLPRAMKRASIAASLTCTKKGVQSAFPTLDDIDKRINDIDNPQQHDL
ncbi:MAG: ribokinase [Micavibrio sp.]|nr:MAG: ribokinase [Micavibrio sp.]